MKFQGAARENMAFEPWGGLVDGYGLMAYPTEKSLYSSCVKKNYNFKQKKLQFILYEIVLL